MADANSVSLNAIETVQINAGTATITVEIRQALVASNRVAHSLGETFGSQLTLDGVVYTVEFRLL
jgi:hypothetical protein